MPDARCTRGPVRNEVDGCAHEHTGQRRAIRHSLRNGFTAYNVISPVIGFLATVAGGTDRQLDTSAEVSGPHVFAVRFNAVRLTALPRPPLPVPRS